MRAPNILFQSAVLLALIALSSGQGTTSSAAGDSPGPARGPFVAESPGGHDDIDEVDQGLQDFGRVRHPLYMKVHSRDSRGNHLVTSTVPSGYTPAQIRSYLGLSGDGTGQTIAVVDAYDDPNIVSDLNKFSSQFGLPKICGTSGAGSNCFNFRKATPQGKPPTDAGWSLEIALDVEWAHAVAPAASILLVEAKNSYLLFGSTGLLPAIDYAAAQAGVVVISNSWGSAEFSDEGLYDSHCSLTTAVCTFASGDSGNPGLWPAYGGHVVAVGGTTLSLSAGGAVLSETAWGGSGGGVSQYQPKPSYQNGANASAMRGLPDVSYDADPSTGFAVYSSVTYGGQSGWFQVGGTSAGAPQWAAILAVADQLRGASGPLTSAAMQANSVLYGLTSGLADVTTGSNGACGVCSAGPGYDFVTGLGSPRAGIDRALAPAAATATPTATATPSPTPTRTPTATLTSTPVPPPPTQTPIPTLAPTNTPPPTQTPAPTDTPTPQPPTLTATLVPTNTPQPTQTPTPTDTPTPQPPTLTATLVPTNTPQPTQTPTDTPTPPPPTPTATLVPTDTPQPTQTPTPTDTPTPPSPTVVPTNTPTLTPTDTPTPVPTDTPFPTVVPTDTPTPTQTPVVAPTPIPTAVPTDTPTPVPTLVPTDTPVPTQTATPTDTPTTTPTPTATTAPATQTPTATATLSPSPTATATATPLPPTATRTATPVSLRLGSTKVGALLDVFDSNYMNGSRVTTGSSSAVVTSLSAYVGPISASPNNSYQVAIYTDSNGAPGTLVARSATGTLAVNSWNTLTLNANLNAASSYWLMFNTNGTSASANNMAYDNGGAGLGAYSMSGVSFGTWPASFGAAVVDNLVFSLYATYTSGP